MLPLLVSINAAASQRAMVPGLLMVEAKGTDWLTTDCGFTAMSEGKFTVVVDFES